MKEIKGIKRSYPPFRYDIVGSFLRTEKLKTARNLFRAGEIDHEQLEIIEDAEIEKLVEKQQAMGLKAVTDGEFRRGWWHLDFFLGVKGTEKISLNRISNLRSTGVNAESFHIVDKISFENHPMIEHFKYLKNIAGTSTPKFTIPSPALFHFVQSRNGNDVYKTEQQLFYDIINVYKQAIKEFYAAGCRYLQLDDTAWGTLCSLRHREHFRNNGVDPEKLGNDYLNMINACVEDKPEDMVITLHICRGNFHSSWFASGGYEPIAKDLFSKAKVDGFFLEFDNERSGDFSPLRYIDNQMVVLGLITTKHGGLESKEQIRLKIAEASQYVAMDRLCLSPQCGFASTEEGNIITEEEQWEKIKLLVDIANDIWK